MQCNVRLGCELIGMPNFAWQCGAGPMSDPVSYRGGCFTGTVPKGSPSPGHQSSAQKWTSSVG